MRGGEEVSAPVIRSGRVLPETLWEGVYSAEGSREVEAGLEFSGEVVAAEADA